MWSQGSTEKSQELRHEPGVIDFGSIDCFSFFRISISLSCVLDSTTSSIVKLLFGLNKKIRPTLIRSTVWIRSVNEKYGSV